MKKFFLAPALLFAVFIASCSVQKPQPKAYQNIDELFKNSTVLKQHQVGFYLKELGADKAMLQKNADKYFIPASNIKLLSFYTALNMLGDSVAAFNYATRKDSLFIWPMADASFLHPSFKEQKAFDFLKNSNKRIYLISGRYQGERYGKGWNWDDYNEDFQAELNAFPMYGNMVSLRKDEQGKVLMCPDLSTMFLNDVGSNASLKVAKRAAESNDLKLPATLPNGYQQKVPLRFDKNTVESLLTDTLLATGQVLDPVTMLPWRKLPLNAKTFYSIKADSLYKLLLQNSDNFVAEEMLLNCAVSNNLTMRSDSAISVASKTFLADVPDKFQWVDASGLSRMNLITPRDLGFVLQKIYNKVQNEDRLFGLLAAGGKTGTLKNMFTGSATPYVFAKSGSLSNNYNLSGYLIGVSGKKYIFSFMNNNFMQPTGAVKAEVERILKFVHDNY